MNEKELQHIPTVIRRAMDELGITVGAVFVPWSQSRSFKKGAPVTERSLNWRVTVSVNGREAVTADYTAGIAHAPSYKHSRGLSLEVEAALVHETEKGTRAKPSANLGHMFSGKPIEVNPCDVICSLLLDGSAIDHPNFESWASDLDYDTDSRKAEAIYRACLDTGLKLRAALGDNGLAKLREACREC